MKNNWQIKKLGNVSQVGAGNSAPQSKAFFTEGKYPFFRTSDVGRIHLGKISDSSDYLNELGIKKMKIFKKGTLLFPKSGASTFLNHRVTMEVDGYVSSHLATIKADEKILDNSFLFYFSMSIDSRSLMQDQNYPSLRLSDIEGIEICLPNLIEQKRIVKKLDEVFEKIEMAKENIEKNLQNSKEFINSYSKNIFNTTGESWRVKKLGAVASFHMGGTPNKTEINIPEAKIPWIKGSDLIKEYIFTAENFITEKGMKNSRATYYDEGTLLIGRTGQGKTRGTVALLKIRSTTNETVIAIIPDDEKIIPDYLLFNLKQRYKELREISGDKERGGITQGDLDKLNISFPNIEKQKEIVKKLYELSEQMKKLENIYKQKLADLDELKRSVLAKAFAGRL